MTTLAADKARNYGDGDMGSFPVIDNDIIYKGAAVGVVAVTGHARPLVAGDVFGGFAVERADNTLAGHAAGGINVRVRRKGEIKLAVAGAVISDNGDRPAVYASDDDTFTFNPADGTFIGYFTRYESAGVGMVSFDCDAFVDPWAAYTVRETITGTKTYDVEDTGKLFCLTEAADADVQTFPAIAVCPDGITLLAVGPAGSTAVVLDGDNADKFAGPNLAGADGAAQTLTKATQRRGDFVELAVGDADGLMMNRLRGIWVSA